MQMLLNHKHQSIGIIKNTNELDMTQEDKKLLLKDLCSRLPYGVKISVNNNVNTLEGIHIPDSVVEFDGCLSCNVEEVKPYLFPPSSMTEEQKKEYNYWKHDVPVCHYEYGDVVEELELLESPESFDYLLENKFDCNGLIPMGLALDATGLNIY